MENEEEDFHNGLTPLPFYETDGGKEKAGYGKANTGDCVPRAIALGTGEDYGAVYPVIVNGRCSWFSQTGKQRQRKRKHPRRDAIPIAKYRALDDHPSVNLRKNGTRYWFRDYMNSLGWEYVSLCGRGKPVVSLCAEELGQNLPDDRTIICMVTGGRGGHYTTLINGVCHDTWNPSKPRTTAYGQSKCRVYGCWRRAS